MLSRVRHETVHLLVSVTMKRFGRVVGRPGPCFFCAAPDSSGHCCGLQSEAWEHHVFVAPRSTKHLCAPRGG